MATPPPRGKLRSLAAEDANLAAERRANLDAARAAPSDSSSGSSRSVTLPSHIPMYRVVTTPGSNPTRAVVYALLLSVIFLMLGGSTGIRKLRNGINATVGRPQLTTEETTGPVLSVEVFTGWAILFVIFVALADNDTTAPLGVGFAYLFLLSIVLTVGPDAFNNLASLTGQQATSGGGSGGGRRKR